jgi:predicted MFS family arabinose efflux permease
MPSQFVGITETISLMGIVLGIVVARLLLKRDQVRASVASALAVAAALLLVVLFATRAQWVVLAVYLIYMILFEAAFAYSMSAMLISCPPALTKAVVAMTYAFAYGGVALSGLVVAIASDHFGLDRVSVFASVPLAGLAALTLWRHTRATPKVGISRRTHERDHC